MKCFIFKTRLIKNNRPLQLVTSVKDKIHYLLTKVALFVFRQIEKVSYPNISECRLMCSTSGPKLSLPVNALFAKYAVILIWLIQEIIDCGQISLITLTGCVFHQL